jgi:hypothetical protein
VTGNSDPVFGSVRLFPDPASDQLSVEVVSRSNGSATLKIFDPLGRQLAAFPFSLHIGTSSLKLPVKGLASGTYFLVAESNGRRQIKSFIKKD